MGARTDALERVWHILLTVWPSEADRNSDGWSLRAASGVLSSTGQVISIERPDGSELDFPPLLPADSKVVDVLGAEVPTFTASVLWTEQHRLPRDVDLSYGVGEVAIWYEGDGYESRDVRVFGDVSRFKRGGDGESITVSIAGRELVDRGDFWGPGAEITDVRFPDVATDGEPAARSQGLLPPYVFAPIGSSLLSPVMCVENLDAAVAGASNLVPPNFILGNAEPNASSSTHQFVFVHPSLPGRFMAALDSTEYQGTPFRDSDAQGGTFWRIAGFYEVFGGTATTWTTSSDEVTSAKVAAQVAVGDHVRKGTDTDDEYVEVESVDGSTITLIANYPGAGGAGTGRVHRRPVDQGYQGYMVRALGGDVLDDGSGPRTKLTDVLIWALRFADLDYQVAFGDIVALRPRLDALRLSHVLNERQPPWEWVQERLLPWLPIRFWVDGQRLRCAWVGPILDGEIDTQIDLDELADGWREDGYAYDERDTVSQLSIKYRWDIHRQTFRRELAQNPPNIPRDSVITGERTHENIGRSIQAYHRSRLRRTRAAVEAVETDVLEFARDAGAMAAYVYYLRGERRTVIGINHPQTMDWLRPGHVATITETGQTWDNQRWRAIRVERSPGAGPAVLWESVPV